MFPLKKYKYTVPQGEELGAFGVRRKFDVHTGVDLYCENGDEVISIEDGIVVAVEPFTGEIAGFPWWNNTYAVAVLGKSGVINYGEIIPECKVNDIVKEGDTIGYVTPVLKIKERFLPQACFTWNFIIIIMVSG